MRIHKPHQPIFLFGVGRCGSTYQQTEISRLSDIWIWGEHDGIVANLFSFGDKIRKSPNLNQFCFNKIIDVSEQLLTADLTDDATHIAWANGFNKASIKQLEQSMLLNLFAQNLPAGKVRWGFKEIRYGPHNKIPERLLAIFPAAKIIHTVRNPFLTVESNIFSWNFAQLKQAIEQNKLAEIEQLYAQYIKRWVTVTNYFLHLETVFPQQIFKSNLEDFADNYPALLNFLDVEANYEIVHPIVNRSALHKPKSQIYRQQLQTYRTQFLPQIILTATNAGYDVDALLHS